MYQRHATPDLWSRAVLNCRNFGGWLFDEIPILMDDFLEIYSYSGFGEGVYHLGVYSSSKTTSWLKLDPAETDVTDVVSSNWYAMEPNDSPDNNRSLLLFSENKFLDASLDDDIQASYVCVL